MSPSERRWLFGVRSKEDKNTKFGDCYFCRSGEQVAGGQIGYGARGVGHPRQRLSLGLSMVTFTKVRKPLRETIWKGKCNQEQFLGTCQFYMMTPCLSRQSQQVGSSIYESGLQGRCDGRDKNFRVVCVQMIVSIRIFPATCNRKPKQNQVK